MSIKIYKTDFVLSGTKNQQIAEKFVLLATLIKKTSYKGVGIIFENFIERLCAKLRV